LREHSEILLIQITLGDYPTQHPCRALPCRAVPCLSDAVLDACLSQDPNSKVACETAVKDNFMLVSFQELSSEMSDCMSD